MASPAAALLADIALQLVILAFGFSLSTIILRGAGRLEHLSLAYPIGLGIFTWILFLASRAGDGIAIWSVKGYGIAAAESIFGARQWGAFGLHYPLNLPLAIAAVRLIDGDVLPGSKIVFALFYLTLVLGCYVFLLRGGMLARVAALGTLLIATTPIVLDHGTNGYANLPMAAYLVLGGLFAIHGMVDGSAR